MAETKQVPPEEQPAVHSSESSSDINTKTSPPPRFQPNGCFWAIILTCSVIGLLSALENTVVTTALPHIVAEFELGENYVWVTNVFFLTGAAVQPLFGQLADIYGRRWVTMAVVAFFTLGSVGAGGIYIIIDVIVSDLVPLCIRGNYMAVILLVYTVGMALGPWVGGEIIATTTWRWVFYINLPIGGAAMVMIFLFLRVQHSRQSQTAMQKLLRIDYAGNLILIGSTVAILLALTYGGTKYPWSAAQVLSPLILGLAGLVVFMWYETKAAEPVVPPALFRNRTASIILAATFLNSALLYWIIFFLPVYFQAPLHLFGFAVSVIGLGLFTLLDQHTTLAEYVVFQAVAAIGSGFVLNTLLPAVQAQLDERHQAATTAAWSFMRSFGSIWGVAIPAAVFNNRFSQISAGTIADPAVRALFEGGNRAYENAYAHFVCSFPPDVRDLIVQTYADALKLIWQLSIVFSGINFLIILFEKQVPLRTELETEFGLEEEKKGTEPDSGKDAEKGGEHIRANADEL
ncbi:hypothetical protein C8A00DRAFT_30742 [Chaetomidium leptoderma]|uniref:Major facilitator superfamily (MFS) profile domain-containing protein n=1 Tax=Chaetomidium leptoderma TaxID=669021 RepID=A0AAN6ZY60_9PEZI|nr:hypothetical protein C8A00DRAFT_30742 [Chaetomidium leptoderma]